MDFVDIDIPYDEAENYFKPAHKMTLNKLFYKDANYEKLLLDTTYYLIGEKGSGKTTYCAYFCNNTISEIKTKHKIRSKRYVIGVDDYNKIIQMKKDGKLNYTHYITLWKAILLTKLLASLEDDEVAFFGGRAYEKIRDILESYHFTKITMDSFSPVSFMDNEKFALSYGVKATSEHGELGTNGGGEYGSQVSTEKYVYEDNWTKFINDVADAVYKLKLVNTHYLFIDGIDTRPADIPYEEYRECIYPLVRAVYDLNNDILARMKDRGRGRLQIILLTRLDIFLQAGLGNAGSKISDNSAFLNWAMPNEKNYRTSELYALVNKMLADGNKDDELTAWDKYFNFKINRGKEAYEAFTYFLRLTTSRPRDFVKLMKIAKERCGREGLSNPTKGVIESNEFQQAFSIYFVDSIRTGLGFYYSEYEIDVLRAFLESLKMLRFTYGEFVKTWDTYVERDALEKSFGDTFKLLKLLFDFNIIGYFEEGAYYRWRYREVSITSYDYSLRKTAINENSKFKFHWAVEKEFGLYLR